MPRKVPQIYTDFTDFVLLLKNLCSSVKSVGLCGFGLKPILIYLLLDVLSFARCIAEYVQKMIPYHLYSWYVE